MPPGRRAGGTAPAFNLHHIPRPQRLSTAHTMEGDAPFFVDCNLQLNIVIPAGHLLDAFVSAQCHTGSTPDVT